MIASISAIFALALTAAQVSPVQVHGDTLCPSSSEVAALLPELLPSEPSYADVAWIEAVGSDLRIELRSLGGDVLFSRRLTSNGTCAELATVAAVIIASWTAERNPGLSLLQPGVSAPVKPVAPPPSELPPSVAPQSPAAKPARELDLSLAMGGSASSAGLAGTAQTQVGLRGARFGLRVGLAVDAERSDGIQAGRVAWRRYHFSAGPTLALVRRPVLLEMGAELFAGLTTIAGRSFDVNRTSSAVAPGLGLALRLGTSTSRLRPWIEMGGQYWLAEQAITITRPGRADAKTSLPSLEARLVAGLSLVL